jgi:hypothetical protein
VYVGGGAPGTPIPTPAPIEKPAPIDNPIIYFPCYAVYVPGAVNFITVIPGAAGGVVTVAPGALPG